MVICVLETPVAAGWNCVHLWFAMTFLICKPVQCWESQLAYSSRKLAENFQIKYKSSQIVFQSNIPFFRESNRCMGMIREKDRLYRWKSHPGEKWEAQGEGENLWGKSFHRGFSSSLWVPTYEGMGLWPELQCWSASEFRLTDQRTDNSAPWQRWQMTGTKNRNGGVQRGTEERKDSLEVKGEGRQWKAACWEPYREAIRHG